MEKIIFFLGIQFLCCTSIFAQNLISSEFLAARSQSEIVDDYNILFIYSGVEMYKINYTTLDVKGILDTASGLVVIPDLPNKKYPLLCYQHGTIGTKDNVPSNLKGGYELSEIWGSMGYITFTPDLLGLGDSRGFHPFVHAASEASAAIDMMSATKEFLYNLDQPYNEQLFITGYSQGGHSAAALHQELNDNYIDQFPVTASAPMSGPYDLSGIIHDVIFDDTTPYGSVLYLPYTLLSYQTVYENLFTELDDIFKPIYADIIQGFWEGTKPRDTLESELLDQLIVDYGAPYPVKMLLDDVADEMTNNYDHPLNVTLRENDVYDWTPEAPTRLIYCEADEQVPYTVPLLADSVMNMNGAEDVEAIDANSDEDHYGCIKPALVAGLIFFGGYQEIEEVTLVANLEQDVFYECYPNPANEFLFIKNRKNSGVMQLIDVSGKVLLEKKLNIGINSINIDSYPSGIYFLRMNYDEGLTTQKVILSK